MGAVLLFLRTPAGRYILLGVAVLAVLGGLYGLGEHKGASKVKAADAKAQLAAKADVATHEATAAAISSKARADLSDQRVKIETRTRTLIQKVPVYVDAKSDAACTVGNGFVSVFNAAASGQADLPRPAGGSGGSPSGVPLSAVLSATVEDFGIAYDWKAEALKWREWYGLQRDGWLKH